jgi:peptide-methionine (S)-S-oxide reductase
VGYCGGKKDKPTYRSMGDHTETIAIDFDPKVITYQDLLKHFWQSHRCDAPAYSTQYMNAIFYLDEKQKTAASKSLERLQFEELPGCCLNNSPHSLRLILYSEQSPTHA